MDTELSRAWLRELNKSKGTRTTYAASLRAYPGELDREQVRDWAIGQLEAGAEPATVRLRVTVLRLFSTWLHEEGEAATDVLAGLKLPAVQAKPVRPLSAEQLSALLKASAGKDFTSVRDRAIVQVFAETGMRLGEMARLKLEDVSLDAGRVVVVGKGNRTRVVPVGPVAISALSRYLRARAKHPKARLAALWLGAGGRTLKYSGLDRAMRRLAQQAGIPDFHNHLYRHTLATRWLAKGGTEGGLMAVAGWRDRSMLDRYAAYARQELAAAEAARLGLGEDL